MTMETQCAFDASSMLGTLESDPIVPDVTPRSSQSFASSEPIQTRRQIRLSVSTAVPTYSDSAYKWLAEVLDGLTDFGRRHGHYSVIKLTEDEYQWLDDVLEELICSLGENKNHPLGPLPDYAEAFYNRGNLKQEHGQHNDALADYTEAIRLKPDFVAAYYNRGSLNGELKQYDGALVDYTVAIRLKPDFADAYANRGVTKVNLGMNDEAKVDFQAALKLAEQQENDNLKTFVEEWLQELNNKEIT